MATSKLTSDERQVLGGLILEPGAPITHKTPAAVAERVGLDEGQVRRTLEKLDGLGLVHRDVDATTEIEFWIALESAIEEYEAQDSGSA